MYDYSTAGRMNDASSWIESMTDTGVTLASYQYLGASGFVNAASAQPGGVEGLKRGRSSLFCVLEFDKVC